MIAKKKVLRSIIILVLVVALGIGGYYVTNAIINRPRYSAVTLLSFDNKVILQLGTHAGMPDHDNRLNGLTITRSQSLIDAIKNSGEIVSSKVDTVQNIESLLLLYEGYFFAVVIENEIIKISSSRIEIANDITPSRFIPYVDECSYDYILGYDINEVVTGTLIRWDENKHFNNFDDLAGAYEKISVAYEVVINYEFKTISLNGYAKGSINRLYPTRILCDDEGMRFLIE